MLPGPLLVVDAPTIAITLRGEQARGSGHIGGPLTPLLVMMVAGNRSILVQAPYPWKCSRGLTQAVTTLSNDPVKCGPLGRRTFSARFY
jgi:hypothetical protein